MSGFSEIGPFFCEVFKANWTKAANYSRATSINLTNHRHVFSDVIPKNSTLLNIHKIVARKICPGCEGVVSKMKSAVFLIATLLVFCCLCVDTEAATIPRKANSLLTRIREVRQAQLELNRGQDEPREPDGGGNGCCNGCCHCHCG